MRIESKLCHHSENKVVVQVNGWVNEKNVGSALAEGSTVEIAEDKAISRLHKRLNIKNNEENNLSMNTENTIKKKGNDELTKSDKEKIIDVNNEPSDWSNELTAIDSEIKRLKWTREDEINFIETRLGYNNRNKITKYSELVNYLDILKKTGKSSSPNLNKLNTKTMIEESDNILRDLSWDNNKGREFLQKEFNVSTRMELDEKQLISFVAMLKSIRNKYLSE